MWKITFNENGKNRIGAFKQSTGEVKTSDGRTRDIRECDNPNFFERFKNGKLCKPKRLVLKKKD